MINFLTLFITKISQGSSFKDFTFVEKSFVYVVVILGTCTFSLVAPQLVASFTGGEGISHEEGRNSILSAMHGKSILGAGAKALGWAAGGAAILGLVKGKKGESIANAAKSGLDNLKKGQDMMQGQRASGIPGFLGKAARAATTGGHTIKSMFSRQGWSNLGSAIGGVASAVGGAIAGNTVGHYRNKRDNSNSNYSNTLKDNVIPNLNSNIKKFDKKRNNYTNLREVYKDKKENAVNDKQWNRALNKEYKYANKILKMDSKQIKNNHKIDTKNIKINKINKNKEKK
ncbi:hypothetical protein [Spiroplasma corruscae]|nr:hypothetical protein [Spiroplasma corruscae]